MWSVFGGTVEVDGGSYGGSKWRDGGSAADGSKGASAGGLEVSCEGDDGSKIAGAKGASGLEVSCGGDVGCKRHLSSCGIFRFLAKTAAWLLDRVASLTVFARFHGGGAGCGDGASNGGIGCGDSTGNGRASSSD